MTTVDLVIPVYNEEKDLPRSVVTLRKILANKLSVQWRIVVADNGSTDTTLAVAQALAKEYPEVTWVHLDQKGRGRALKKTWLESPADVVSYMDVDLSTDLNAYPKLIQSILDGFHIAIGSRLIKGSQVTRSFKREFISRCYNLLVKGMFFVPFHDAQCGFKAISREAAQRLLPLVKDNGWFFDSELLILAAANGYRIKEIPVEWKDDPDTRVKILGTATGDLKGLLRLRFGGVPKAPVGASATKG